MPLYDFDTFANIIEHRGPPVRFHAPDGDIWFAATPTFTGIELLTQARLAKLQEIQQPTKFFVSSSTLSDASSVFSDMFNTVGANPDPGSKEGTEENPIPIDVLPQTFALVMNANDVGESVDVSFTPALVMKDALAFCDKYMIDKTVHALRRAIPQSLYFDRYAVEWYLFFKSREWRAEEDIAFSRFIFSDLEDIISFPSGSRGFAEYSGQGLADLLIAWKAPRKAFDNLLSKFSVPYADEPWFESDLCDCGVETSYDEMFDYDTHRPLWLRRYHAVLTDKIRLDPLQEVHNLLVSVDFLKKCADDGGCRECWDNISKHSSQMRDLYAKVESEIIRNPVEKWNK